MSNPEEKLVEGRPDPRLLAFHKCCALNARFVEVTEWLMSGLIIIVGIHLMLFPRTLGISHMASLTQVIPAGVIALFCTWIGISRIVLASRRKVTIQTLQVRQILASLSALMWLEMTISFFHKFTQAGEAIPPGFEMLLAQTVGDLWVLYRLRMHTDLLKKKGRI